LTRNLGTLTSWNPLGHSRTVMGLIYLYLFTSSVKAPCILNVDQRCGERILEDSRCC